MNKALIWISMVLPFIHGCVTVKPIQKKLNSDTSYFVVMGAYMDRWGNVLDMRTESYLSKIEESITKRGYSVVDRMMLPEALKEIKFLLSGTMDQNTMLELGKMKGAHYIVYFRGDLHKKVIRCTNIKTMTVAFTKSYDDAKPEKMVMDMLNSLEDKFGH